jgi:hypothetical protein
MATPVLKYKIDYFWDQEFKELNYTNEEFNDADSLQHWMFLGFPGKFTGDMCDMRDCQPSWNNTFIELFQEEMGWKDVCTSYYRMMPGTILPTHSDTYNRYIKLFDLRGEELMVRRAIVFLEDWRPGHYAEYMDVPYTQWRAGDTVEWQYDTPHMAANMGFTPRYTLQITGHI